MKLGLRSNLYGTVVSFAVTIIQQEECLIFR